jgi:sodium transport system permease protein
MKTITTVFRKELIDTIRDRRTIMFMIVIPLLLFPVLFKIMFSVQESYTKKAEQKMLKVTAFDRGNAVRLVEILEGQDDLELVTGVPEDSISSYLQHDRLDGAFVVAGDFDEDVAALAPGRIDLYYKSTDDQSIIRNRLTKIVDRYEKEILEARFARLELEENVVQGVALKQHNVASMKEQVGKQVGGFLPYIFILFCFMGAMYPAIDLGAGEKERGTLETLLTAPVNRFHILLGKFGVIVLTGFISAIVSMVGLYIGLRQSKELPPEMFDIIVKILGADSILLIFSLLLPLTVFFAGVLLSVSLSARSFKEAQTLITPLNFAVIIPAAVGMVPGISMNFKTALIPVLNVSLATKEIIAGTMSTANLIVVYLSLAVFAVLSLWGSVLWFKRENTIFRS